MRHEKIIDMDLAPALWSRHREGRFEDRHDHWHFRGGISMAEAAAQCAPISYGMVCDMRISLGQEGQLLADETGLVDTVVLNGGADHDVITRFTDFGQLGNARNVDQEFG